MTHETKQKAELAGIEEVDLNASITVKKMRQMKQTKKQVGQLLKKLTSMLASQYRKYET